MKPEVELGERLLAMRAANRAATHWMIDGALWSKVRHAKDRELRYLWSTDDMVQPVYTLLGLPVIFTDNPDELRLE